MRVAPSDCRRGGFGSGAGGGKRGRGGVSGGRAVGMDRHGTTVVTRLLTLWGSACVSCCQQRGAWGHHHPSQPSPAGFLRVSFFCRRHECDEPRGVETFLRGRADGLHCVDYIRCWAKISSNLQRCCMSASQRHSLIPCVPARLAAADSTRQQALQISHRLPYCCIAPAQTHGKRPPADKELCVRRVVAVRVDCVPHVQPLKV